MAMGTRISRQFALFLCVLLLAARAEAACAPVKPPYHVVQSQAFDKGAWSGTAAYAAEAKHRLPRLVIADAACRILAHFTFGTTERDSFEYRSAIRFRALENNPLGMPILLASGVAAGGSNSLFETILLVRDARGWRDLLPKPAQTLIAGGIGIGDLGGKRGPGVAVWQDLPGPGANVDPHPFRATLYPLIGAALANPQVLRTKRTYDDWKTARQELGIALEDELAAITDFDQYR